MRKLRRDGLRGESQQVGIQQRYVSVGVARTLENPYLSGVQKERSRLTYLEASKLHSSCQLTRTGHDPALAKTYCRAVDDDSAYHVHFHFHFLTDDPELAAHHHFAQIQS